MNKNKKILFFAYLFVFLIYIIFTYSLTAVNLILFNNPLFVKFQFFMWNTFFNNRKLLTYTYTTILSILWIIYIIIILNIEKIKNNKFIFKYILILSLLTIFATNNLSYDIYNYIFSARILVFYQKNPYLYKPLDFPHDDWLRFMHNIDSISLYGTLWVFISSIFYIFGLNKLALTIFLFRLLSILGFILLFFSLFNTSKDKKQVFLTVLNPFLIIELAINSHNDSWMLWPLILAVFFLKKGKKYIIISSILLLISSQFKMPSIIVIPIFLIKAFFDLLKLKKDTIFYKIKKIYVKNIELLVSLSFFALLFYSRSKYFLPWYLTWSFIWFPFIKNRLYKTILISLSITASYRYIPFLLNNGYNKNIIDEQIIIGYSGIIIGIIVYFLFMRKKYEKNKALPLD